MFLLIHKNTSWGDLLTSYNVTAITYYSIGNPTKWRNAIDIEWYGRQMSLFANNDGSITDYSYNADGIRTSKTLYGTDANLIGTTEYVLDGTKIVAEKTGSQWTYYLYDESGAPAGIIYDGVLYGYRKNLQGDIVEIVHSEYNVSLVQYTYGPYGEVLSISGTMADTLGVANPFRYRGYYYDNETGFYYLQSRYYDPVVGRFLNADAFVSTGQGIVCNNMFAYCANKPINNSDVNGMCYTPNDIKACLRGTECCDHNHTSSDYISVCLMYRYIDTDRTAALPFRDVTGEVGNALYKASVMARELRIYANQMDAVSRAGGKLGIYITFYAFVNHNALWDIKTPVSWERTIGTPFPGYDMPVIFCGMIMTPESLGNFSYGFLGAAYGISYDMLITGSYYAAGFPSQGEALNNEIADVKSILLGYYLGFGMFGS